MSAELAKQASSQAGFLFEARKQLFHAVPPLPSVSLEGKTAIVTGSNVGLGLECVRHFLNLRAERLIMAVRSLDKGNAAANRLRAQFPNAKIEVWLLDMASFRSVQDFAARCTQELDRIHVAVLNAGLGKTRLERVNEGRQREATLQINYLATALLAILLLPKMRQSSISGPNRLTIISSGAALGVKLPESGQGNILDSVDKPNKFDAYGQYSLSKLLVTMFTARLAESVNPDEVIVNCCDPGAVKGTGFLDSVDSWLIKKMFGALFATMGREPVDGARIYVHASLGLGKESHGSFTDWRVRAWPVMMYGDNGRQSIEKLWNETMEELSFAGVGKILSDDNQ